MQKRKEFSSEATEDEAEDEEREADENRSEEEEARVQKVDTNEAKEKASENEQETAQIERCAICHIIINDANLGGSFADSEQDPCYSEGYLLCQRCVQNFSIQPGR